MRKLLVVAAAVLFTACDSLTGPDYLEVRVLTSGEIYVRAATGSAAAIIDFTVANTTRGTVWVSACGREPLSEALIRQGAEWVSASAAACPANLSMAAIPLEPGGLLHGRRAVSEPGEYRLRVGIAPAAGVGASWRTLSNIFVVQ